MVRVFITTSHISCIYLTLYAKRTWRPEFKDVLLVDIGTRRAEVLDLIEKTAQNHSWGLFHSYSDLVPNHHKFEPSLRKRLTMKWKEAPFVRDVYRLLLNRFLEKRDRSYKHELRNRLHPIAPIGTVLSIHAHTETYLRVPLMQAYPGSTCEFFEHGQGDYIHILSGDKPIGDLHALFAKPFRKFLESRGIASGWVLDMVPGQAFHDLAKQQVDSIGSVQQGSSIDRPIVYVILEALDMYNVPVAFWGAYIDRIVELVPDASRFHFVLKPHPRQSPLSLEHTAKRCDALGLSYSLLDSGTSTSAAAEVDFSRWADKTEHVFCLVSSACFYLSQLYPNGNIQFHYSTSFMERWISEAPAQYKRLFEHMKPLIKEVFAERCQPY